MDMENLAGSWKKFRGYVYTCTNGRGSLHLWPYGIWYMVHGNCFVGKYFVVCFSTTKILPPLPKNTRYTVIDGDVTGKTKNENKVGMSSSLALKQE